MKFPPLKDEDYDRGSIKKKYFRQKCKTAVKNLSKNHFTSHFCEDLEEAKKTLLGLIPENGIIGCGDSHTIFALDLEEDLKERNCITIPHSCAVNHVAMENNCPGYKILGDKELTREVLMNYLVANVFLLGANAITMDGQIINIDGAGNRIAGSLYGSDKIIVVAGANKLVKDVSSGLERIRFTAAQMNNIKYDHELACNKSGVCQDCRSEDRYCNITSIIHKKPMNSDFHVLLIAEELGF